MCGIKGVKRPARSRDPLLRSFFDDHVCDFLVIARASSRGFATTRFRRAASYLPVASIRALPGGCHHRHHYHHQHHHHHPHHPSLPFTTPVPCAPLVRYTTPVYLAPRLFVLFRCAKAIEKLSPTLYPPRRVDLATHNAKI